MRRPMTLLLCLVSATLLMSGSAWSNQTGEATGEPAPTPDEAGPTDQQGELTPDEIVDRSLETSAIGFQEGEARILMRIADRHGDVRERRIHVRSMEEHELSRSLVRIVSPPELAGQSYLFLENPERDDDIWIFLPALDDAPRRISGSQKSDSFIGSNITYADIEGQNIREGEHTRRPDEEVAGFEVYVIDTVSEDSEYSSIRQWIRQSDFVPLRIRFFRAPDVLEKTLFTEQVDRQQGRTYVRQMTMVDREETSTTVIVETIDFEAVVSPSEFTRENLTR